MPNCDVATERVRQHLRRILDQLRNNPIRGPGFALPSSRGRRSMRVFDPKTGQTVTIKPKPRTKA
jgi:hypothetical protein